MAAGCGGQSDPTPDPEPVEFEVVGRGQSASLDHDTTEAVIRTEGEWEAYQEQLRSTREFTSVDFSEEMVLVAARQANSGGYSIEINAVERLPEEIIVRYSVAIPDDACITTMGRTTPYQVVKIPQSEVEVRFESRREVYRCSPRGGL